VDIIERERSELELELENNPDMKTDIKQALNELLKREEQLPWKVTHININSLIILQYVCQYE